MTIYKIELKWSDDDIVDTGLRLCGDLRDIVAQAEVFAGISDRHIRMPAGELKVLSLVQIRIVSDLDYMGWAAVENGQIGEWKFFNQPLEDLQNDYGDIYDVEK